MFAYVNHARIHSWNQPLLSNEGKVSCSRKQQGPLLGLELTTDRHPPTTSQTSYPLRQAAFTKSLRFYMFDSILHICLCIFFALSNTSLFHDITSVQSSPLGIMITLFDQLSVYYMCLSYFVMTSIC